VSVEFIKDKDLWDRFIDNSPYGLLSHKWNYLKIIEKHSGYRLSTCGVFKGDLLIGVIPFFCKNLLGRNAIFSPPPKTATPYMGFVMSSDYYVSSQLKKENLLNYFVEEMEKEFKARSPFYIEISVVPNFPDIRSYKWNNYSIGVGHTFVINLDNPIEHIWKNFHKNLKSKLRAAEKCGFEITSKKDTAILYRMIADRYAEQKLSNPLISEDYLKDLSINYPENIKFYYILNESGDAISATATQEYKERFIDWIGSTKSINYVNEYMEWRLMQEAKSRNYRIFDFAGAGVKNISMFKSKFNPVLEVCYKAQKKDLLGRTIEWVYSNFAKKRII
jgi:hypothetical protein